MILKIVVWLIILLFAITNPFLFLVLLAIMIFMSKEYGK